MAKVNLRLWLAVGYLAVLLSIITHLSSTVSRSKRKKLNSDTVTGKDELERIARSVSLSAPHGGRFVILTAATWAYRQFVRNLACSLWRAGRYELLLVALDSRMYHTWMPDNVRVVLLNATKPQPLRYYNTGEFDLLSRRKFAATRAVLQTGYHVLFTDSDVVWCDAAASEIALQSENAHLVVQRAAVRSQAINTGFYYARATEETEMFLHAAQNFPHKSDDQTAANKIACDESYLGEQIHIGPGPSVDLQPSYCRWNDTATISFLPSERFPLGCTTVLGKKMRRHSPHFVQSSCSKQRIAFMHYSCYAGWRKKESMIRHRLWIYDEHRGICRS